MASSPGEGIVSFFSRKRDPKTDRELVLRKSLLANDQARQSESAKKAIEFCELCIDEYEAWADFNEARWSRWQKVVIIGGVVATLAGVITLPDAWILPFMASFGWLRGVPAAVVTIAAGYLSSFTYREDTVRHEMTAGFLWIELAKFQTHATPYNKTEEQDISAFVNNIGRLVENELLGWRALVQGIKRENGAAPEGKDEVPPKDS
jgi:hypothetical protein